MHAIWLPERARIRQNGIFSVQNESVVRPRPGLIDRRLPPSTIYLFPRPHLAVYLHVHARSQRRPHSKQVHSINPTQNKFPLPTNGRARKLTQRPREER